MFELTKFRLSRRDLDPRLIHGANMLVVYLYAICCQFCSLTRIHYLREKNRVPTVRMCDV